MSGSTTDVGNDELNTSSFLVERLLSKMWIFLENDVNRTFDDGFAFFFFVDVKNTVAAN